MIDEIAVTVVVRKLSYYVYTLLLDRIIRDTSYVRTPVQQTSTTSGARQVNCDVLKVLHVLISYHCYQLIDFLR